MPELPEVRTVARTLDRLLRGKVVEGIRIFREKNVLDGAEHFRSLLLGHAFLSVDSYGKHLLFHLSGGSAILAHLRMEGKYFLREEGEEGGRKEPGQRDPRWGKRDPHEKFESHPRKEP